MKKEIAYILHTLLPSPIVNTWLSIRHRCFVHPKAKIISPSKIQFGKGCRIEKGTIIFAQGEGKVIKIGKGVIIEPYCSLNNKKGTITIGEKTHVNHYSMIQASGEVRIGKGCAIAPYTRIVPNHTYEEGKVSTTEIANTTIGNNVWICAGVTIVIGANIGKNSVIAANAAVVNDIPADKIAGGIPAKIIKDFDL